MEVRRSQLTAVIKQLLFSKTVSTRVQFLRYGAVAVVSLVVDAGILFASKKVLGLHDVLAASIGFSVGLIVNYVLCILWVFPPTIISKRWHELVIFLAIGLVGLGLTDLIIWGLSRRIGLVVAKIAAVGIVFFWNFFARKKILYDSRLMETTL